MLIRELINCTFDIKNWKSKLIKRKKNSMKISLKIEWPEFYIEIEFNFISERALKYGREKKEKRVTWSNYSVPTERIIDWVN